MKGYTEKEIKLAAKNINLQYGVVDLIITECRNIRCTYVAKNCAICGKILSKEEKKGSNCCDICWVSN